MCSNRCSNLNEKKKKDELKNLDYNQIKKKWMTKRIWFVIKLRNFRRRR